jgi:hypothetical protein
MKLHRLMPYAISAGLAGTGAETRDGKAPAECGKRRIADSGAMRMFSRYASDLSVRPRNSGNHRGGFVPPSNPRVPGLERERRL